MVKDPNGKLIEISFSSPSANNECDNVEITTEMKVDNIIYVTDKFNVSTRAYRELTHHRAALPKGHVLQKRKSELYSGCTINEIGNRQGVQGNHSRNVLLIG